MSVKTYTDNSFLLFDEPLKLFSSMIDDIKKAEKKIYLQTYRFLNDSIGQKFRDELTKKSKQGVEVYVLIDSWGAGISDSFFSDFIGSGGKLKFFEKIKLSFDIFSQNHRRNHRKLLIIDSTITYIGSANLTAYCLSWRECAIRLQSDIANKFEKIFVNDFDISNKFYLNKKLSTRVVRQDDLEIIRDVPSNIIQPVREKYKKLIKLAEEEILIETPYFLPGSSIRKALLNAAEKGIKITIITPMHSDMSLFDILRDRYFGLYHEKQIKIMLYTPGNLHAKAMLVDKKVFFTGSSNFDYRSLRFMHEINISGNNPELAGLITSHLNQTLEDCVEFDYEKWKSRPYFQKFIESLLVPLRHLF
ncbi:MAG TPA: phosphatidylserine/phosphatidylglycerophosphate/cardiolipin synthase family protein [Bacteroidales bacterium]|nr:phosphatidylserine/phosphatidylglycerophosphate/cardiolipin synthase family protein [Bacteroidales bacterium]